MNFTRVKLQFLLGNCKGYFLTIPNERYKILAINTTFLKNINHFALNKAFRHEKNQITFLTDKKNVMQLDIPGNPCVYNFFTIDELKEIIKKITIKNENAIRIEQKLISPKSITFDQIITTKEMEMFTFPISKDLALISAKDDRDGSAYLK